MKSVIRFIVSLLMPFLLIFGGGWLVSMGLGQGWMTLAGVGVVMVVAGLAWGLFLYLWAEGGADF